MKSKKIDLGEFIVVIKYDKSTGHLIVNVLDELGSLIESIDITEDEFPDEDSKIDGNIDLDISLS